MKSIGAPQTSSTQVSWLEFLWPRQIQITVASLRPSCPIAETNLPASSALCGRVPRIQSDTPAASAEHPSHPIKLGRTAPPPLSAQVSASFWSRYFIFLDTKSTLPLLVPRSCQRPTVLCVLAPPFCLSCSSFKFLLILPVGGEPTLHLLLHSDHPSRGGSRSPWTPVLPTTSFHRIPPLVVVPSQRNPSG